MSAGDQAPAPVADLEARWQRRPVLSWTVRIVAFAGPLAGSLAVAWGLTSATPTPTSTLPAVLRWVTIAVVSSVALVGIERLSRRLLPIASLLGLSLVFPDQAPSRFKIALRTGTTAQLQRRIDAAREHAATDTPAEAATRVIELVAALRVHDHLTRGHAERVRAYTQMIADEMGLPEHELDRLRWAGLLHDVGKLLVPTSILNKPGRLTDVEFDIIKTHPENGRRIVGGLTPWLGESARAVWEHHEKWDGSGYPRGLAGTEISLAARIVAVADVYDVLTSARSYKEPISPREARRELARCAGSHFDPEVVRAFLNISIGRTRRATGPLSWLAQLSLFPTAALSSAQAASTAVVVTGALGASSAGVGTDLLSATGSIFDPRPVLEWVTGPSDLAIADGEPVGVAAVGPGGAPIDRAGGDGSVGSLPTAVAEAPETEPGRSATVSPPDPAELLSTTGAPTPVTTTSVPRPVGSPEPATGTPAPRTTSPATTTPATTARGTTTPDTTAPDTTAPDTTAPDTTAPGTTAPATTTPPAPTTTAPPAPPTPTTTAAGTTVPPTTTASAGNGRPGRSGERPAPPATPPGQEKKDDAPDTAPSSDE